MAVEQEASKQIQPIGLRLPADLKEWLSAKAAANRRSLSGEAVWAIEQYRRQQESERHAGQAM